MNFKSFFYIKRNWIYSDRVWCDFSDAIIEIYKITELWKQFEKKTYTISFLNLKLNFIDKNKRSEKISDETIIIWYFLFNRKLWLQKLLRNAQNLYVSEKRIVYKLLKISILNFDITNWRLKWNSIIWSFNGFLIHYSKNFERPYLKD